MAGRFRCVRVGRRGQSVRAWNVGALVLLAGGLALSRPTGQLSSPGHHERDDEEKRAKARVALIVNFLRCTIWPQPLRADRELRIAVVGGWKNLAPLETALERLEARNRSVKLVHWELDELDDPTRVAQLRRNHCVLFGSMKNSDRSRVLRSLRALPILTIGESVSFARQRGIIELFLERERYRFRICNQQAVAVGIRLDAKLLELAELVTPGDER